MAKVFIGLILLLSHFLLYFKGLNDGTLEANENVHHLVPKTQVARSKELQNLAPHIQTISEGIQPEIGPAINEALEPDPTDELVNDEQEDSEASRSIAGERNEADDVGNDVGYFQEGRLPKYEEDMGAE